MDPLTAPVVAAAALLAVAAVLELARPAATVQALRTQGLPATRLLVRLLGVAELVVVALALTGSVVGAALLAAVYAAFTVFVAVPLLRGQALSSCGCFGVADTPPTASHIAVTAALSGVCLATAVRGGLALEATSAGDLGVLLSAALLTWMLLLVLIALPRLRTVPAALESPA